ncbi:MAG TPA: zf-HC2 domain-containing protein [Candidatus Limnocylindrales bacterium]|nr:zf-HC2 domain-containing protein [Candidatus Limnocylindrales bacterium]
MSRFPRLRRRPDHWSDPHDRARTDLAERMDGPLGLAESTWLDEHLAGCEACTAVANAYEDDRLALRTLRTQQPEPPRDLWARTAAAIESTEAGGRRTPEGSVRRSLPLGALSGVAVVVIMIGVGLATANLPLGSVGGVKGEESPMAGDGGPAGGGASASLLADATPIVVAPGDVGYVDNGPGGGMYRLTIDEVCPAQNKSGCPTVAEGRQLALAFTGSPKSILASPSRLKAVAISDGDAGDGDEIVVVDLPQATERPQETARASASVSASVGPSPAPTASSEPSLDASVAPSASAAASASSEPIASIEPSATPSATAAQRLAIASGIEVVGESAAFSADGKWFAFTARPADGTGGTDVYAWRVGDERARRITQDGASYFASWSDDALVASRPDDSSAADAQPSTVSIDPGSGAERDAGEGWRPAIDPTGKRAIVWMGSLRRSGDGATWVPAQGVLELRGWSADGPERARGSRDERVVSDAAPRDFDVRWDESGEWVAVWVADAADQVVGRLTLYHVDTERNQLEKVEGAPVDVPALPGFSIGDGRLAWATPRGQGGEGSRIQIAAWSKTDVGIVESSPGEDPVVIR